MNRIGATSPAPRETARIAPVRMPGIASGSTIAANCLPRVAPSASDASRISRGTVRSASSVATITTGRFSSASVSAAQMSALAPHDLAAGGRAIDRRADELDEETEPEQPEHDRRHAGEVGDRDARHDCETAETNRRRAFSRPRARSSGSAPTRATAPRAACTRAGRSRSRRRTAPRRRHQDDQHHRAEDRGEDAARRHPLLRGLREELPRQLRRRRKRDVAEDDATMRGSGAPLAPEGDRAAIQSRLRRTDGRARRGVATAPRHASLHRRSAPDDALARRVDDERGRRTASRRGRTAPIVRAAEHHLGQLGRDGGRERAQRSPKSSEVIAALPRPSARSSSRRPPARARGRTPRHRRGRGGQDDAPRGLPARGAERERGFAVGARHRARPSSHT